VIFVVTYLLLDVAKDRGETLPETPDP
jgi:hypothetical protein